MKIKFGAIVTDGRNKIGGHVASKNRAGNYLKTKSTPSNPMSSYQSAVRSDFGALAQSWRGLSEAQRASWIAGAPSFPYTDIFGDSKVLSGFGLYMQLNGNLNSVGATLLSTCPSPATVSGVDSLSAELAAGVTFNVTFGPTPVPASHKLVISATPNTPAGLAYSKSNIRFVQSFAAAQVSPADIRDEWVLRFGDDAAATKVYVGAHTVNITTGQVSPMRVVLASEG